MDIVERLRKDDDLSARMEAADEIERLRAALQGMLDRHDAGHPQTADTVTAARAALEQK